MASGQAGVAMEPRRSRSTRSRSAIPLPDLDYDPQKGSEYGLKWVDLGSFWTLGCTYTNDPNSLDLSGFPDPLLRGIKWKRTRPSGIRTLRRVQIWV